MFQKLKFSTKMYAGSMLIVLVTIALMAGMNCWRMINEPVEKPFSQGLFFQILTFFVLDGSSCRHQHFILLQLIHKSS
ncbi:hypothetical protein, partial [Desulfovulcanus sp.]